MGIEYYLVCGFALLILAFIAWGEKLFKKGERIKLVNFHLCRFTKPVVSKYVSFNYRDVIYKCNCGKKTLRRDVRFEKVYPFETAMLITEKEFLSNLN